MTYTAQICVSKWVNEGEEKGGPVHQAQYNTLVITVLRQLRQENHEFKASLGSIRRPCQRNNKRNRVGG